jgi:hypothetical protein
MTCAGVGIADVSVGERREASNVIDPIRATRVEEYACEASSSIEP